MTTHELARKLLEGPDLMVTRRGYEGGVHEVHTIQPPAPIHLDYFGEVSYYGPHQYHDPDWCMPCDGERDKTPIDLAIHLS